MAITDDLGSGDQSVMDTPEDLFRRYHRPVVAFFMRRGFSDDESRDLAQETFFRVFKHIDGFRGESSMETWLFQVASNLYKNTLRSQTTKQLDKQEVLLEAEEGGATELDRERGEPGQLASLLAQERARKLRDAMEDLPPQMRQAVLLRIDRDMKYREIAVVMRVSIETVKAHLYQARQQLREKLADYFTDIES